MGAGVPRLRVLVLTTSYPTPEAPVAGIFVREYVEAVRDRFDVTVVHLQRAGVRRIEVARDDEAWRVRYPRRPAALWHLLAGRRAVRLAGEHDLVHAHFFLAALPAVLFQRKPVVVSEHWSVFLPEDPTTLSPLVRLAASWALNRARVVLPVSGALERALREHGVRAPMEVVPNVVDERLFYPDGPPPAGPTRLISVGLFYEAKGIDVLLRAVARLDRDVRLDLVGDGEPRARYEALARDLGLAERVTFHGLLPKSRIAELLRGAHLYVSASRYENNPVVLLEALASGLPVVATKVGGVPEIVGDDGLLTESYPAAVAAGIEDALDRLDGFDRAAIARRAAERYGAERIGERLVGIYERLTDERA